MAPAVAAGMPLISTSTFPNAGVNHKKTEPKYAWGVIGMGAGEGGIRQVCRSTPITMSPIFEAGHNM
jgi:hypothetical protein